jgi:dihydrofolate reductase
VPSHYQSGRERMIPRMVVIAAMDRNGAIGKENTIPWKVPEDLQRFKERTMGFPMIMGRTTWESFGGRALPGRVSIILTSHPDTIEIREKDRDKVCVVASLEVATEQAISLCRISDLDQYFVIGGAKLYEQVIHLADEFDLTTVDVEVEEPDTYFPKEQLNERLAGGEFAINEYHSTLGYKVISDTGTMFEILCVQKPS